MFPLSDKNIFCNIFVDIPQIISPNGSFDDQVLHLSRYYLFSLVFTYPSLIFLQFRIPQKCLIKLGET